MTSRLASGTRLTVDLDALAHNYGVLQRAAGGVAMAPVVKADGYGLGAGPIARRLWTEGARSFFVARVAEGEHLRAELGVHDAEILVLDGLTKGSERELAAARLTPVLTSLDQIKVWAAFVGDHTLPAGLHFDTGMNRLGLAVEEAAQAASMIAAAPGINLTLVMSHLSFSTTPSHLRNALQLERFQSVLPSFIGVRASLAASAGAILAADYRFDLVRPGISLYGGGPAEHPHPDLRAVAMLEAPILQIRKVRAGESVGYGAMFTATHDLTLAVVEAGYADGLLRTSFAKGPAAVNGQVCPLVMVSMDLIGVDISHVEGVNPGDPVELLGGTVQLDDLAAAANTVAHECLVRLSGRAERTYRGLQSR